jgi:hypothetical protein
MTFPILAPESATQTQSLLERVQAATGADRELDGRLAGLFGTSVTPAADFVELAHDARGWGGPDMVPNWDGAAGNLSAPAYTASLDAALDLVERVLPGASVLLGMRQTPETLPWARVGPWHSADATGANPPLAILSALLTALASADTSEAAQVVQQPRDEPPEPLSKARSPS